jgi:hypothetical protein
MRARCGAFAECDWVARLRARERQRANGMGVIARVGAIQHEEKVVLRV